MKKKMKYVYNEHYNTYFWVEDFDHEDMLNSPHSVVFTLLGIAFCILLLFLWS